MTRSQVVYRLPAITVHRPFDEGLGSVSRLLRAIFGALGRLCANSLLGRAFWGCSLANLLDSWKAQMGYTQKLATGKWRARWRAPDGTLRSKTFARERDAVRHLRHQEVAVDLGEYIDGRAGKVTFAEWTEHYQTLAGAESLARPTRGI